MRSRPTWHFGQVPSSPPLSSRYIKVGLDQLGQFNHSFIDILSALPLTPTAHGYPVFWTIRSTPPPPPRSQPLIIPPSMLACWVAIAFQSGPNPLVKIAVAQVYLLLGTIKEDSKWETQAEQLQKLIDDHGMEVFAKYFTRLVAAHAGQIFLGQPRPGGNGNFHLLMNEMKKISHDVDQANKIAESIETGTEDIFRDFDMSTFMEAFKLDALEKTILALAFKMGSRPDLKTKADAILSTNFPTFINILNQRGHDDHADLTDSFIAILVDRFIQYQPPNLNAAAKSELVFKVQARWHDAQAPPPSEVLAALDLVRVLADKPPNALATYIQRTGIDFTRDVEACVSLLQNRPQHIQLSEEQVSIALTYTTISQTPQYDPSILAAALRRVLSASFRWQDVVSYFDHRSARISSRQFLRLYNALLPIAQDDPSFDIQKLWGGNWEHPETQLSFICAFASLQPDQLDASSIPGLVPTLTLDNYTQSPPEVQQRAAFAVKHALVSVEALSAVFHVALHSVHASQSVEAKRLFQEVVVPNLDIFVVSAFGVPKPWPTMAVDTLNSLFESFLYKRSTEYDFVLDSLWKKDKEWVVQQLINAHAVKPTDLPLMFEHALKHKWLDELVYLPNGFGLDLAALAHAEGYLDLASWARRNAERSQEIARSLLQFLVIKASLELQFQRPLDNQPPVKSSTTLQVRTVAAFLQILEDFLPKTPLQDLIMVQRSCITVYPRLINYGEGFDDIIDANGKDGNALPPAANAKMEEHYKRMYGDEIQVRNIVEVLDRYKHSRDPLDQDVFACMIHGLFDEYAHYVDYPLEALATTAVLFGGIISHKLISDLPLKIGLGMILEAVRDYMPEDSMYKFGLQALMQLFSRFKEWPGFCRQLLQIPGLQGTEAWKKAEDVVRDHEDELARSRNGAGAPSHGSSFSAEPLTNGNATDGRPTERQPPPFTSINAMERPPGVDFEEPSSDTQGKIQFVLNNLTETTLQTMCQELRDILDKRHQQWFASHLVEERAKMQPNYHQVYLELVKLFEDNVLWSEVLRETYVSVARMLNSEATMQNSTERSHLKNLGGWLGLLTLARDKPIKHKNIAFKQLLIEAHDTKRLIVVIPFVCKVLLQGVTSTVFRPPNPWLMDIIHLLIELYHHAELKLNLKFEIEVLCKGLNLDHKSIEPSGEILNRATVEEPQEMLPQETLETFENLSLNGITTGVTASLSPQVAAASIPDLGPLINIPPTNEMVVTATRLHEIVRTALTRALQDIIQPVVDRSVTIAAISTQQMIHKDFATEPDESRVRTSAINMVKATAGSLALVTSKEPLRANFTNYMRNLSNDLPQGLPEGTIIMCVNSNLDLACNIIEKQAEERAIPEIEEMIEPELEARRRHRLQRPNDPYVDASLSRWAWTIPNPFKLSPNMGGLNPEQMAIYDDFARQPRTTTSNAPSHVPSASDATRSLANEVLQEQFSAVPSLGAAAEAPAVQHLNSQLQQYAPVHAGSMASARPQAFAMDGRALIERVQKLLMELQRVATEAREEHFADLPRPHPVLDVVDALVQHMIKASQTSEEFAIFAADQITQLVFNQVEDNLALESLVHVLETIRKISGPTLNNRVASLFRQQPASTFLHMPLLAALLRTDLLDWRSIDMAMAKALQQRKEGSLDFLDQMIDLTLLGSRPLALYGDFVRTLEAAWVWVQDEPDSAMAQRLRAKLSGQTPPQGLPQETEGSLQQDQMEYVFEEWMHLCNNPNASESSAIMFVQQVQSRGVVKTKDDLFLLLRVAIDLSVERFEHIVHSTGTLTDAFLAVDALAKMINIFVRLHGEPESGSSTSRAVYLDSILALITLVLNHHHVKRAEHFNQRVFHRLLSVLLYETNTTAEELPEAERSELFLKFAARLADLGPRYLPGFVFGWLSLLQHRVFLPNIMKEHSGWAAFTKLMQLLLEHIGEQIKAIEPSNVAREIYRATLKLLVILQHDYVEYMITHAHQLTASVSPLCKQLLNAILMAAPPQTETSDPLFPGLQIDRLEEIRKLAGSVDDSASQLREWGLLEVLDHALLNGPSEDTLAHIARAIVESQRTDTGFGYVPINANLRVIEAVTLHVGNYAVEQAAQKNTEPFNPASSDFATLSMLLHELPAEARYYLIMSITNQLRFPNAHTSYFSRVLLEVFGQDINDPEETDIRQQITRVLLERLIGFWPQPFGLVVTVVELLKNEKYMFFDLPFVKSNPEVIDRFHAVLQRAA
ncbi:ccr4-not transcription complex subunit [Colletotrichum karsti]|uniref:General negative regulator of transcription subunit 1 n=1 Tax=Colletotrichum karsti TaxID=1095194 RepID=A0A9P6LKA5_9PEZI|nr:ccr4-not transcription complex subunit [Colletotrichum karsti]KAF9875986.1 ccr4-not transcription complex subunit [Colletotrichum karsti]